MTGVQTCALPICGVADNFWGPTGNQGPCGPSVEVYIDDLEVGTLVFNEYFCSGSRELLLSGRARLEKLAKPGVDVGLGLERLLVKVNNLSSIYETDLLKPLMDLLPSDLNNRSRRVVADHARGVAFLITDGVRPSNRGADYILRRLLRRLFVNENIGNSNLAPIFRSVVDIYDGVYPELKTDTIQGVWNEELKKFSKIGRAHV